jgi:GT2 family glycosyltransferase/glycosyltransferase involved in cell wall biosynthesis
LKRLGDDVLVLAREADPLRPEFDLRRETRDGVDIAWLNNTFASIRSFRDTYTDERIDAVAARVIGEFNPDVAHIHHLTCLSTTIVHELAARNVPVLCTLHDYWLLCQRGQLLDRDLQPCESPAACSNCLGPEAYASPAVFKTRASIAPLLRFVPNQALSAVRTLAGQRGTNGGEAFVTGSVKDPAVARRQHMRGVMQQVTHFFAPSAHLRDRFIAAGVDPLRISVSEYGWSLPAAATPAPLRRADPEGPLQIGFIGSLMVSKAPHLAIEASARLPAGSCKVQIFGDHADYHGDKSYREWLGPLLRQPHVTFHGGIDRDGVRAALAQIDVLVVPSIWPENSPLVIREAFVAGVPVIASRIGGIPETVTDGVNGFLVEPDDVADLARAFRRLIDDPALLPRLRSGITATRTIEDDVMAMRGVAHDFLVKRGATRQGFPRLAAVVLNYNTPDQTFLATRSLLLSRRRVDDVIVVDNSSDERCRLALTLLLDRISFIPTGRNLGFSGGMNAGIDHALKGGADAILLVNSDVVVPADCLTALERGLSATPGAGIAGPVIISRTSPDRIASSGIAYNRATGRMLHRNVGTPVTKSLAAAPVTVDSVSGCMMLVKREVFERVGTLDPEYFFSFEDVDFCLRARDAGFSSIVVPAATVLHEGGKSMGTDTRRFYFGARNHLLLAGKSRGSTGRIHAAVRSFYIVVLNVAHAFRAPGGSLAGRLVAVARGTRDFFHGRAGGG